MTNRIESLLRTMTERTRVVENLVDDEIFSWAFDDLDVLLDLSYKLTNEIKVRRDQAYDLMSAEIKEI